MPIRVPRTTMPLEPAVRQDPAAIVPTQAIANPAGAVARTAQQAAGLAAEIYQEERDREVATRVAELDIERRKADGAVITTYRSALGKDAVERRAEAMAAILENGKRVREAVKDPVVARLWKQQDAALTLAATADLDAHYRQQNVRWQADTLEARADLLTNDLGRVAGGDGANLATGELSREAVRTRSAYLDAVRELGDVLGWSAEQVERAQRTADTRALGQVAESLVREQRFDEALAVLERHGDRIDVGRRDELAQQARVGKERRSAALATQALAQKAQTFTLDIAGKAAARGGTLAEQKAWALATAEYSFRGRRLTAEEYDDVVQRMERHYRFQEQEQAAEDRRTLLAAERFLAENPTATLADNPELLEAAKRGGHLKGLLDFQRTGRYSTDPEYYAEARAIPDAELSEIPADLLWVKLRPHLSNQDLDELMARHARAVGNASADQLHAVNLADRIEMTARALGILPADPTARRTGKQQIDFDAFRLRFDGELKAWQAQNGKKPSLDDAQRMLDLKAKDHVERLTKGLFWDTIERFPLETVGDRMAAGLSVVVGTERVDLKRVPEQHWAAIGAYLREQGEAPTAQAIVERWVAIGRPGDLAPAGGGR